MYFNLFLFLAKIEMDMGETKDLSVKFFKLMTLKKMLKLGKDTTIICILRQLLFSTENPYCKV